MDCNCHVSSCLILQLRKLTQIWRTCETTQPGWHQAGTQNLSLDFLSTPILLLAEWISAFLVSLSLSHVYFPLKNFFFFWIPVSWRTLLTMEILIHASCTSECLKITVFSLRCTLYRNLSFAFLCTQFLHLSPSRMK